MQTKMLMEMPLEHNELNLNRISPHPIFTVTHKPCAPYIRSVKQHGARFNQS